MEAALLIVICVVIPAVLLIAPRLARRNERHAQTIGTVALGAVAATCVALFVTLG